MKDRNKKPLSKKTKTILWISISCAVAVVLGTVGISMLFFKPSPQEAAMTALNEVLSAAIIETDVKEPEIVTIIEENNSYEMISFEENESEAVAVMKVYAPDIYSMAQELPDSGWSSEEEMEKDIIKRLENAKVVETEVELVFTKSSDDYQPVLTSEFVDAYYGGILRLKEEYLLKLVEEMEK